MTNSFKFKIFVSYLALVISTATFNLSYSQKVNAKGYVLDNDKNKLEGKIYLGKNFWFKYITIYNSKQGISQNYAPNQLRKFVIGDSTFVRATINSNSYGINESVSSNNFALLLINDSLKFYKSYIPTDQESKEVFLYFKPGFKDIEFIENTKSSVIASVRDCKDLVKDIDSFGFEYNEKYFKNLFSNYNAWLKDSTIKMVNIEGRTILKADSSFVLPKTYVSHEKPETLKLKCYRVYIPAASLPGVTVFTVNRYSYKSKINKPCGVVGEDIRPILKNDPVALQYLNKYRNYRRLGIVQMWVVAPAFLIATINSNPEINSGLYYAISAQTFAISGAVIYHYVARKFLKKSVTTYNRNLLKKYEE
jgi:hypothetical protein